jgi:hypothetical protein
LLINTLISNNSIHLRTKPDLTTNPELTTNPISTTTILRNIVTNRIKDQRQWFWAKWVMASVSTVENRATLRSSVLNGWPNKDKAVRVVVVVMEGVVDEVEGLTTDATMEGVFLIRRWPMWLRSKPKL